MVTLRGSPGDPRPTVHRADHGSDDHAASLDMCRNLKVDGLPVVTKRKCRPHGNGSRPSWPGIAPSRRAGGVHVFDRRANIEALDLRWSDVDLAARRALIRQTKIGAERRPHLPPVLVAAMANIESNREPDAKVFKYSTRDTAKPLWRAAAKRAKITPLSSTRAGTALPTALLHRRIDPITVACLEDGRSHSSLSDLRSCHGGLNACRFDY